MTRPSLSPLWFILSFATWLLFLLSWTAQAVTTFNTEPVTWQATPFNGKSIPLAVKGPCNNVWQSQGNHTAPANLVWPGLWDFNHDIKGWYASIRVDGTPYMLLGNINIPNITLAKQDSIVITPTQSSFLLQAGPITVNMTFFSPVEPADPVKMSSPFSYLYFTFTSSDAKSHNVQLYSDISGEWISGDTSLNMTWAGNDDGTLTILQATLLEPEHFQINGETCQDGTIYWAMLSSDATSWQISGANNMRIQFANGTALTNSADQGFRTVSDNTFTTFAIAVDVGPVNTTVTEPVVYAIGLVRDPVITYLNPEGQLEELSPLYATTYPNATTLIKAVLENFTDSVTAAQALDAKLAGMGGAISSNYADLITLSTRQAFGAMDLTIGQSDNEVRAFARDIGALGSGGVNPVDVIYAAMPAYITLWPDLLGYVLTPLLEYQNSKQYPNPYAAQDIGLAYPNATGDSQPHDAQVEQTANMLILALAHAQATGNSSLLSQYYGLLGNWATFLVANSLAPGIDETTSLSDGITGANQTNLALKGIIGIGAMAKISGYAGVSKDQSHYQGIAEQYAQQWTSLATTADFISLNYGSIESGIIYNLYADKLLQTNLINQSVYALQTSFYESQLPSFQYGLPLSTSNPINARADWSMFAAAVTTDSSVRGSLIGGLHSYLSSSLLGQGDEPFAVVYDPNNGTELTTQLDNGGIASFAQGAVFAPLALNISIQNVSFSPGSSSDSSSSSTASTTHKTNAGAIAGGVIGGLIALTVIVLAFVFYRRRKLAPQGRYNRESRLSQVPTWKSPIIGDDVVVEPFSDVEERNGRQPVMQEVVPIRFNEKSAFRRPGGLPANPRNGAYESRSGWMPPYMEPEMLRRSYEPSASGFGSSESRSRRTDDTNGSESLSLTTDDPSSVGAYLRDDVRRQRARERRTTGSGSGSGPGSPPGAEVLVSLREVAALRREVERIRIAQEERGTGAQDSAAEWGAGLPPPPSYEDEVEGRRRGPLPSVPSSSGPSTGPMDEVDGRKRGPLSVPSSVPSTGFADEG